MTRLPFIVALTGGIACGKTTVEQIFADLGVPIVDADKISHQVVEKGSIALKKLVEHFGKDILHADGSLNRAYLRIIIFNSPKERLWVNALLHPIIHEVTLAQFSAIDAPYLLWVVPLLIENKLYQNANRVLVVDCDPSVQRLRLQKRDQIDKGLAEKMLLSQVSSEVRRRFADDIIINNDQTTQLTPLVIKLHHKYLNLANNHNHHGIG
ncbi:MAG: dephospho-CoA kinase [Candidatus Schmidhempelia sp.]|nr:dephospho-CoA kinase [Candidatus Schmidhempelia sp.]